MRIRQDSEKYNIGKNIRRIRMENKLTQEQTVAKLQLLDIEISRGTYSQIEMGIVSVQVRDLLALCEIFHVEIGAFFEGMTL